MPGDSLPLQDLPCVSLETSIMSQSARARKHKQRVRHGVGLDAEYTPTEPVLQRSPCCKHPRLSGKGKENDAHQFVLARRSKRREEAAACVSWSHLPDELVLRVLLCLPMQDLLTMSAVCRRWHRLALDESLWRSVDLEGLTHMGPALQQVLKTGVRRLRCPHAFVEKLHFTVRGPLQITHMDLSSSIIPTSAVESIMSECRLLQLLSLEGLQLSDPVISSLSKNPKLLQLNLGGCSGFSALALAAMLKSCSRIEQLNISWCDFNNNHVKSVVDNLSSNITHLNISGYRERLMLDDVKVLVMRCPFIHTLDLSDSTLLMADSLPVLQQLKHLLHLSLSRCYHIHLAALTDVGKLFPLLCRLDVFGIIQPSQLPSLQKEMPHVAINSTPFSSIARPTPTGRTPGTLSNQTMWNSRCRLRFKL